MLKLKEIVLEVLREDIKSRNSDLWLIIQVLRKLGIRIYINYEDLDNIPSFETITRLRRIIQNNEGKYPPSPEVDDRRNKKREECRGLYKNSNLDF